MNDEHAAGDERPKIKVTDRRLFDSDGNLRDEAPPPAQEDVGSASTTAETPTAGDQATPPQASPNAPAPAESTADVADAEGTAAKDGTADTAGRAAKDDTTDTDDNAEKTVPKLTLPDETLLKFVEEQYVGGLLALGAMPEPQSGQLVEDLELARLRIEILGLLQDSTEGARSDDTSKAFEDVLYQLRMAYLQKRKVAKL